MKIIDIHSHLQFPQFDADRQTIIDDLAQEGIGTITVGTDLETSKQAVVLAQENPHLWATVGYHPTNLEEFTLSKYKDLVVTNNKVVAIGECGLDYYRDQSRKNQQKAIFIAQIELAIELNLPLMIHGRPSPNSMDAYDDIINLLSEFRFSLSHPGNIHFFVGNTAIAKKFLDFGFSLSFDGPITFSRDYDEVIKYVPLDMIHAETDAPFAAPNPHRSRRNEPKYVTYIIDALAEIKAQKDKQAFKNQLLSNAIRIFNLNHPS